MPATQSLREFLECLPISLMRQLLSGLELLSPRRRLGRRDDQALAVGTDIQRRPRLNFQKVEDGAINYQRQAVSVLRQLLQHAHSVSPMYHQWGYGTKALLSVVISGCAAASGSRAPGAAAAFRASINPASSSVHGIHAYPSLVIYPPWAPSKAEHTECNSNRSFRQ